METSNRIFRSWVPLTAILLFGFLLRLYHLDYQSVWNDEAYSITVSGEPLGAINDELIQHDSHPPLHYYLLHFVFAVFGYGALQARALSLVFGTLSILMTYALAGYLFDRTTGLLAAFLLAISQLGVMFSQEARNYVQLLLFSLTTTYLFVVALRRQSSRWWWAFVASATLMMYTHYHSAFVLLALSMFGFLFRRRYPLRRSWLAGGVCFVIVAYLPWALSGAIEGFLSHAGPPAAAAASSLSVHWYSFFNVINWFNNGKLFGIHVSSPWWTFMAGGLLFTLPAALALMPVVKKEQSELQEAVVLVNLLWLVPVLLILVGGVVMTKFNFRYISFCVAPYYILVARGIRGFNPRILRVAAVLLIGAYSAYALRAVYFIPYKENNRDALAYMVSGYSSGDCAVFVPPARGPSLYWKVYYRDHPAVRTVDFDAIKQRRADCNRVWLVWDRTWWKNLDRTAVAKGKQVLEQAYRRAGERKYYGAEVSLYVPER
jgi:4-amino-4-deoxy-L-arabinose transferase-like glycosyltransferase